MKRLWLSVTVGMLLFARQDILLWQRIFEANEMWEFVGTYHEGWFIMLWAMMLLGFIWLWPNWKLGLLHGAIMFTLVFGGLPDVFYYWLRLVPIPDALPWLDLHPLIWFSPVTRWNLVGSTMIWIAISRRSGCD